jgi:hypothetical protein
MSVGAVLGAERLQHLTQPPKGWQGRRGRSGRPIEGTYHAADTCRHGKEVRTAAAIVLGHLQDRQAIHMARHHRCAGQAGRYREGGQPIQDRGMAAVRGGAALVGADVLTAVLKAMLPSCEDPALRLDRSEAPLRRSARLSVGCARG